MINPVMTYERFIERSLEYEASKIYNDFFGDEIRIIPYTNEVENVLKDFYGKNYTNDEWKEIMRIMKIELFK